MFRNLGIFCCLSWHLLSAMEEKNIRCVLFENEVANFCHNSNIDQHISSFRKYTKECFSVTEVGRKNCPSVARVVEELGIPLFSLSANDLTQELASTDMLLISSISSCQNLFNLLSQFSANAQKYIYISHVDELEQYVRSLPADEKLSNLSSEHNDLWSTIQAFIHSNSQWELENRYVGDHGFVVLKRSNYMRPLDCVLKNKIILCTGPSLHRRELLKSTTESDMKLVPFKNIFLSTNDEANLTISFNGIVPICQLLFERGHQLDCLNCLLTTIKNAINHPNTQDDDIILFKHESCYINDMYLFRKAVEKLLEGYDMVVRHADHVEFCQTNGFLMKVSAARKIFRKLSMVRAFNQKYRFCEDYFTKVIVNSMQSPYILHHRHSGRGVAEIGLFHILPPGVGPDVYWDEQNYFDLFH